MKLLSQIWTAPNHLDFRAEWKGNVLVLKGSWFTGDNTPYESNGRTIRCKAIPFFVFNGEVLFGRVGETHDDMFARLYPKVNDPSLEVVYEGGRMKCVNFRNAEVLRQQGRLFVFDIDGEKVCIVTMWFDCPDDKLFEEIKKEIKSDCYYIHKNKFIKP